MGYVTEASKIVVEKSLTASVEKLEMLRGFGFDCKHEFHCGFWLVHYKFPKLKLVESGHVVLRK